jgi:crossover junction endodeoxyribonuclease RuvC
LLAAKAGVPIALHTPTEVKAAVTGTGRAGKEQVAKMVVRILQLSEAPKPVDTTDALALAICHHWRGMSSDKLKEAASKERSRIKGLQKARR